MINKRQRFATFNGVTKIDLVPLSVPLTMRVYSWILLASVAPSCAFLPSAKGPNTAFSHELYSSSTDAAPATTSTDSKPQKYLGLLTFDLDDSLYPLEKVINEANEAFVRAMNNYGFTGMNLSYR